MKKYFKAIKIRGNSIMEVFNLTKKEGDEWINRKERGSAFVIQQQKKKR